MSASSGGNNSGGGGGNGDTTTVINLNISGNEIVNERKLTRRIKSNMGTGRYVFGA